MAILQLPIILGGCLCSLLSSSQAFLSKPSISTRHFHATVSSSILYASVPSTSTLPSTTTTITSTSTSATKSGRSPCSPLSSVASVASRREVIQATSASASVVFAAFAASFLGIPPAQAAADTAATASASASVSDIFLRLKNVPTFSIVTPEGIPYMIWNGGASATGYFFMSFNLAQQALQDAIDKDKSTDDASAQWSSAKIIVVPLAVAMQLAFRNTQRKAVNNGILFSTYNDIVSSEEGVRDARIWEEQQKQSKALVGSINYNPDKWTQKGRVPLFYIQGMTVTTASGAVRSPRYFNRKDCVSEWLRQQGQKPTDDSEAQTEKLLLVVDMADLYRKAISSNNLALLDSIELIPVAETNQVARTLVQSTPSDLRYSFKDTVLVGSSQ